MKERTGEVQKKALAPRKAYCKNGGGFEKVRFLKRAKKIPEVHRRSHREQQGGRVLDAPREKSQKKKKNLRGERK